MNTFLHLTILITSFSALGQIDQSSIQISEVYKHRNESIESHIYQVEGEYGVDYLYIDLYKQGNQLDTIFKTEGWRGTPKFIAATPRYFLYYIDGGLGVTRVLELLFVSRNDLQVDRELSNQHDFIYHDTIYDRLFLSNFGNYDQLITLNLATGRMKDVILSSEILNYMNSYKANFSWIGEEDIEILSKTAIKITFDKHYNKIYTLSVE